MTTQKPLGRAALAFKRFTAAVHRLLPGPLQRVPETFIGYAVINGSGFVIDMVLLSIFFKVAHLPYPVSVTMGYAIAAIYAFIINRWLNFRAHGHVGSQSAKYTVVMVSNYVIWILGFSWLMETLGVQFQLARFLAACIEGIYIYVLLRWWVFRRSDAVAEALQAKQGRRVDQGGGLVNRHSGRVDGHSGRAQSTGADPAVSKS